MNKGEVTIGDIKMGGDGNPLVFIAGPCVIEERESTLRAAERLRKCSDDIGLPIIFKSSYDKANRTSLSSFRGPGIEEGLRILESVKDETGLPLLTDVHSADDVSSVAGVVDILQLPAFLCRQTDLVLAAGRSGLPVNIKKGQFMAPWDIKHVIDKVFSTGNRQVTLTERGVSFGYNNLVVDMRSLVIMRSYGLPVVYDATHSVQLPGGRGGESGGEREFVEPLAYAAVSVGCDAVFMEVHESPDRALCDGPNMISLDVFPRFARRLLHLNEVVRGWSETTLEKG
jgi:2-dehydro-3-deoxyphosphooctonate aldolase (KDO 8-P synthase)